MLIFLGGHLNFYHSRKEKWLHVKVEQPARLTNVLEENDIPLGEVHLAVLNGDQVEIRTAMVTDQDEVKLFSAVGGG